MKNTNNQQAYIFLFLNHLSLSLSSKHVYIHVCVLHIPYCSLSRLIKSRRNSLKTTNVDTHAYMYNVRHEHQGWQWNSLGECSNVLARVFSHQQHLALVWLRCHVTLETILKSKVNKRVLTGYTLTETHRHEIHTHLVSALLLTHLAVPPQFLKSFRLYSVRNCFRR